MNRRIRIAHVIESLGRVGGGAERLLAATLAHLDTTQFESHVVYLFGHHGLTPEIRKLGVPITCLEMRDFSDWRRGLLDLRRHLRDTAPDIVHTVLQRADIYGRLAAVSAGLRPIVSTLHECPYNPEVFIDNPELSRFRYGAFKLLDKVTARACNDAFLVVSQSTRRNLQRYFSVNPQRVRLLYSGIDLAAVDAAVGREDAIRRDLGISPRDVVLLNVGRLFQQKGQRYLIQAMRRVVDHAPNVRLLIRGDGADESDLRVLTAALGLQSHVTILDGYRSHPEVLALLRVCDIFVFPSLYEGLGIALIEALASRRPCVASNIGPIPEVIDDGRTGLLVPPMDPAALAEGILALVGDPDRRRQMGEEGRKVVEERFDIRRHVRLLEQAYIDLMAGRWIRTGSTSEDTMEGVGAPA